MNYSEQELYSIYELGRVWLESGYSEKAEAVFRGLISIDGAKTPSRVGLSLVKIEKGEYKEALDILKESLEKTKFQFETKLSLCAVLLSLKEAERAQMLVNDIEKNFKSDLENKSNLRILLTSFKATISILSS